MNTRREPYNDVRVRKALRHLFNRELMIQKLAFNEYVPMDSMLRQRVREPGQRERSNTTPRKLCSCSPKPDGRTGTRQGRLSRRRTAPYFGNRLRTPGLRTLLHGLPGGSAQARHHAESPARDVGDLGQAARRSGSSRWRSSATPARCFPNPKATFTRRWPTRRTRTTSPASRTSAPTRSWRPTRRSSTSTNRVKLLRELDGIFTNEHHIHFRCGRAPFQRLVFWNKFGYPQGVVTRIGDYRDVPTAVVARSGEIQKTRSRHERPVDQSRRRPE